VSHRASEVLPKAGGQKSRLIELAFALPQEMQWHGDDGVESFTIQPGIIHGLNQEKTQRRGKCPVPAIFETFH